MGQTGGRVSSLRGCGVVSVRCHSISFVYPPFVGLGCLPLNEAVYRKLQRDGKVDAIFQLRLVN